jgi:two-component system, OmpR family, alkaline phosphatase synthesis response regulator PhoP
MKILVVDDEKSILNLIRMNLELEGYKIITSMSGLDALQKIRQAAPDFIILDIMLPDISGYNVLRKLRRSGCRVPVILLTAKDQLNDKLLGLQFGADDYMTKPFSNEELILRIRAITKRFQPTDRDISTPTRELQIDGIRVLLAEREVFIDGQLVEVTSKEFDTLTLMLENCNRVFTREKLLESVWGYAFEGNTRAVDILIQRLRKKLGPYAENLRTIYGVGYKLVAREGACS